MMDNIEIFYSDDSSDSIDCTHHFDKACSLNDQYSANFISKMIDIPSKSVNPILTDSWILPFDLSLQDDSAFRPTVLSINHQFSHSMSGFQTPVEDTNIYLQHLHDKYNAQIKILKEYISIQNNEIKYLINKHLQDVQQGYISNQICNMCKDCLVTTSSSEEGSSTGTAQHSEEPGDLHGDPAQHCHSSDGLLHPDYPLQPHEDQSP